MNSPHYTPRLGFWIATVFVIIITVFAVVLRGAGPGNGGGRAADLWLTVGLAILPGSCVGLLQACVLALPSLGARVWWSFTTIGNTSLGWCVVFALLALLGRLRLLPTITNDLLLAIFYGLLIGTLMGTIIGLVVGILQQRIQRISWEDWIVSNIISWSIGIAIPLAVFFALLSQIDFFF
jgi:hypothetical protein